MPRFVRQGTVSKLDEEQREVEGIAVPLDTPTLVRDWFGEYYEQVAPGAVKVNRGKLFNEHREIIGTQEVWEEDGNLCIRGHISKTRRGNDAYELAKDGALSSFSIGFCDLVTETVKKKDEPDLVIRKEIELFEVSLVPFPAYEDAVVESVRGENRKEQGMSESTQTIDLSAIEARLDTMQNSLSVLLETAEKVTERADALADSVMLARKVLEAGLDAERAEKVLAGVGTGGDVDALIADQRNEQEAFEAAVAKAVEERAGSVEAVHGIATATYDRAAAYRTVTERSV